MRGLAGRTRAKTAWLSPLYRCSNYMLEALDVSSVSKLESLSTQVRMSDGHGAPIAGR